MLDLALSRSEASASFRSRSTRPPSRGTRSRACHRARGRISLEVTSSLGDDSLSWIRAGCAESSGTSSAMRWHPSSRRRRKIDVSLESRDGSVYLCVHDTGEGSAPEAVAHASSHWQADGSTTRSHGGLGIGLALVRHLVDRHGGTKIAVASRSGRRYRRVSAARFTVACSVSSMTSTSSRIAA